MRGKRKRRTVRERVDEGKYGERKGLGVGKRMKKEGMGGEEEGGVMGEGV